PFEHSATMAMSACFSNSSRKRRRAGFSSSTMIARIFSIRVFLRLGAVRAKRQDDLDRDAPAFSVAHGQSMRRRIKLFEPLFGIGQSDAGVRIPAPTRRQAGTVIADLQAQMSILSGGLNPHANRRRPLRDAMPNRVFDQGLQDQTRRQRRQSVRRNLHPYL